jgi:peptidoglycan/LPS O-acetylase OafA/YrhL
MHSRRVERATEQRIPTLDGLRGIAVLLVMIFHASLVFSKNSHILAHHAAAPLRFLYFWALGGFTGVDLFFVISGFLITGILYDTKVSLRYFRTFYARRILRIFPLYYAVLLCGLLVVPRIMSSTALSGSDALWYWFHLSNFEISRQPTWGRNPAIEVAWSLSIEEQFYLVWPMVVMLCNRRVLTMISAALVGVALVSKILLAFHGVRDETIGLLTICRIDGLAIGAFIALAMRHPDGAVWSCLRRRSRAIAVIVAVAVVGEAAMNGSFGNSTLYTTVGSTVVALLFGATLIMAVESPASALISRVLQQRLLLVFGRYSYALYLFHLPITLMIWRYLYSPHRYLADLATTVPGQLLFYGLVLSLPLACAWLSWHGYEKRFLSLKRYFRYGQPSPEVHDMRGVTPVPQSSAR